MENLINRLNEISRLEEELKRNRDFESLIEICNESMKLLDTIDNHIERILQKAYCFARLGRKTEAEKTLEGLKLFSLFADQDELYRSVVLVSFFLNNSASELNVMQLNTIKDWLKDPQASKQVIKIVFDYSDLVGNVQPFDNARLQIKQTYFSEELLQCVFWAMQSSDDITIYYNRETNDVQQEFNGYLSSYFNSDQSAENRKLADRIMNSDTTDPIIEGLHFIIPQLALTTFLEKFTEYAKGSGKLLKLINEFESSIMEEYGDIVDSIEDLKFSQDVLEIIFTEIDKFLSNKEGDITVINEIFTQTGNSIALDFLMKVNEQ